MFPEIKQPRTCPNCHKETVYNGWQVDGYGFTSVVCGQCNAVHNYTGVVGFWKESPDGKEAEINREA